MPSPFRLSYNINTEASRLDKNRQAAADEQIALHSAFTLLLDDYKSDFYFTKQIQARSPETDVIHRRYWYVDPNNPNSGGWDGSLWRAPGITADNILNTLQGVQKAHGVKVIEQLGCEPSVHITREDPLGNELKQMLRLYIDCIKGASARVMRLAVDIGQPVTWVESEIDAGFYDELLFTLAAHPEHLLSVHEYGLGDLWNNTTNAEMSYLVYGTPQNVDMYLNNSDAALKQRYTALPSEAHLGRVEIMAQRCRKIGTPIPKMVYTEIGFDAVRLSQQNAVNTINGRVAMGYPTLAQYWRVRYPAWSQARTAFEQVKWLNRAMPDYVVGACLFGKDTSFENGNYHIESDEFQRLLANYSNEVRHGAKAETPPPPPVPSWAQTVETRLADLERRVKALEGK